MKNNRLYVIIPCYNEEKVLPITAPVFLYELDTLIEKGKISADSKLLFVDDGSKDLSGTICDEYAKKDGRIKVIHKEKQLLFGA